MPRLALLSASRSVTGRRENNEDAVFGSSRLAAVADGVGGAVAGEVASRLVIDALASLDKSRLSAPLDQALGRAVQAGNAAVAFVGSCRPQLAGMGTTLTSVALDDEGRYLIAHVGDSRAYLSRDGRLTRLTRDDSLVQVLVESGLVDEADAMGHPQRSIVLDALDGSDRDETAVVAVPARSGDRLLLCSDGLSDVVADVALVTLLAEPSRERCADRLVEAALRAGGRDNVSVLVADAVENADPAPLWPSAGSNGVPTGDSASPRPAHPSH